MYTYRGYVDSSKPHNASFVKTTVMQRYLISDMIDHKIPFTKLFVYVRYIGSLKGTHVSFYKNNEGQTFFR